MTAAERAAERWHREPVNWPPSREFLWDHVIFTDDELADVRRELADRQAAARMAREA